LIPLLLPDSGRQAVVGESHYQNALRAAADGRAVAPLDGSNWDATIPVVAHLVPEPENPYDEKAVRIDVDGQCVGYLPRDVAAVYQPALLSLRAAGRVGTCEGHIMGGGKRNYGIFLHVAGPSEIELAAILDHENAVLLAGDRPVTVTGEEKHQDVLGHLDIAIDHPTTARVSLCFCTIARGKYAGQRAVEVRLDGQRVGELTRSMSQRYEQRIEAALAAGKEAVCRALICQTRDRGVQVELLIG
jgi:hypothetical protein